MGPRLRWRRQDVLRPPFAITACITPEQLDAYLLAFRIQEISLKLQDDYMNVPADRSRCSSPEPEYDSFGRRTNTREQRYRRALQDERHALVEAAFKIIPNYRPPHDYRRPRSFTAKVYIPVAEYPCVNFVGQILGPRGSSLTALNQKAGASIVIRGKGSIKEGCGRGTRLSASVNHLAEPLHCLITATSPCLLKKARQLVQEVIDAATTPDHQNERKRQQLRELAVMNGTFRDDENTNSQNVVASRLITFHGRSSSHSEPKSFSCRLNDSCPGATDGVDGEVERLMAEIEGLESAGSCYADVASRRAARPLPPWRIKRGRTVA